MEGGGYLNTRPYSAGLPRARSPINTSVSDISRPVMTSSITASLVSVSNVFPFTTFEVNFLSAYFFKTIRINVQVQLMKLRLIYCQKSRIFFTKSARARALLPRSVQNQNMYVIYIILSSHGKNQPPKTMLSYVYTLFKFPGE